VDTYLRFRDLQAAGIVNNRASLQYRIQNFGFPRGRLIGPNTRAWTRSEVEAWIAARPTDFKLSPFDRRKAAQATAAVTSGPEAA
jgi:predicted DNA-binding transcriptional regulator AlpA